MLASSVICCLVVFGSLTSEISSYKIIDKYNDDVIADDNDFNDDDYDVIDYGRYESHLNDDDDDSEDGLDEELYDQLRDPKKKGWKKWWKGVWEGAQAVSQAMRLLRRNGYGGPGGEVICCN